jgi:hypothetical protein
MIGLFFGGKRFQTSFGNLYGNIELDATLDESHEWQAEATMNPVETGAPVTDHVIEMSDRLRITGVVTDAPIYTSANLQGIFNTTPLETRTQPVFDFLYRLIKLREPMTVYTKYKNYDNMILVSVSIPRSAAQGEAIEFNAEFVNIRKVATQVVDVPVGINPSREAKAGGSKGSVARKTQPTKETGKKQTQAVPADSAQEEAALDVILSKVPSAIEKLTSVVDDIFEK